MGGGLQLRSRVDRRHHCPRIARRSQAIHEERAVHHLSRYIHTSRSTPLPLEVIEKARIHILDTVAAMVSGSRLPVGGRITRFVASQGGAGEATVVGSAQPSTAINAAMVNGVLAHADETDDSHAPSHTHPGSAIVASALAVAERQDASGSEFIGAVVLGYDVGCRFARLMQTKDSATRPGHATYSVGPSFGSGAAAAALIELDEGGVRHCLSYVAQQASGLSSWVRDTEHMEKAFVFGGLAARAGVTAAILVECGMSAQDDPFGGEHGFLDVFVPRPAEFETLVGTLGAEFEIMEASIKKYSVGSPIQAPVEALISIVKEFEIVPADVVSVTVELSPRAARVVAGNDMPDVSLQFCMASVLIDGDLTFRATHDPTRLSRREVAALVPLVEIVPNPSFMSLSPLRPATVRVRLRDGTTRERHVRSVRGSPADPMDWIEVEEKAMDLMGDILGSGPSRGLIQAIRSLDQADSVRILQPWLRAVGPKT